MLKRALRIVALGALACGVASPITPATASAAAAVGSIQTIRLSNITSALVPVRKTRGDREFGGGPLVHTKVTLYVTRDRRHINAKIHFYARETKGDRTTVSEDFHRTVFKAPRGKRIHSFVDSPESVVNFRGRNAGFQILGPGDDFKELLETLEKIASHIVLAEWAYKHRSRDTPSVRHAKGVLSQVNRGLAAIEFQGNHVHLQHPKSGPVSVFAIVADTGGDDISKDRNPKDDTRIQSIMFKPFRVRYQ